MKILVTVLALLIVAASIFYGAYTHSHYRMVGPTPQGTSFMVFDERTGQVWQCFYAAEPGKWVWKYLGSPKD